MNRPKHRHWLTVTLAGTAALVVVHGIGRFAFTPLVPVMHDQAGLSIGGAANLAAANLFAYLLGSLFTLWKHEHRDRIVWLRRGLALNVLTLLGMGLTGGMNAWLVLRVINGFSNGLVFVYAPSLVLEVLMPRGRGLWSGLTFGGVGLGILLSTAVVMAGTAMAIHWQGLWLLLGACAVPLAWFAGDVLHLPEEAAARPAQGHRVGSGLGRAGLGWMVAGYTCAGFGYIISMTFLPVIVGQTPGLAAYTFATWLLVGLAAVPSPFVWSAVGQRLGDFPALLLAFLCQAVGVVIPVYVPSAAGVVGGGLLVGGTFVGIVLLSMRIVRHHQPTGAGRLIGLLVTTYGVAQMLGPLVAGHIATRTGRFDDALLLSAGALVLGMSLVGAAWLTARARERAGSRLGGSCAARM